MASEWASAVGGVWKKGEVVGADARGSTLASILFDAGGDGDGDDDDDWIGVNQATTTVACRYPVMHKSWVGRSRRRGSGASLDA